MGLGQVWSSATHPLSRIFLQETENLVGAPKKQSDCTLLVFSRVTAESISTGCY